MIITLDSTTNSLTIQQLEATVTNESTFKTSYYDGKASEGFVTYGTTKGSTNGITPVEIAGAPASTYNRNVDSVLINNTDTVRHTYKIVDKDTASVDIDYAPFTIEPGQSYVFPQQNATQLLLATAPPEIGRTITIADDDLLITDVGTRILSNYSGTGIQTLTIPEGIYSIGDVIRIIRLDGVFKLEVENAATQEINTNCFSNKKDDEIELIYVRDNGGLESWIVINGLYTGYVALDTIYDTITGIEEDDDYIYTLKIFQVMSNRNLQPSNLGIYEIYNKLTLAKRAVCFYTTALTNVCGRGLMRLLNSEVICSIGNFYTGSNILYSRATMSGGLLSRLVSFQIHNNQLGKQIPFDYTDGGVILGIHYNDVNSGANIIEMAFDGTSWATSGRTLATGVANYGFHGGCWDGIDSTGAGTSYILVATKATGVRKIDTHDLSNHTTIALNACYPINEIEDDGYMWYVRGTKFGKMAFSDGTYTEWETSINLGDNYYINTKWDRTTLNYFIAEVNGYRIVKFNSATPDDWEIIDMSVYLDGYSIMGISYLESTQVLYVHCYRDSELSSWDMKTIPLQQ